MAWENGIQMPFTFFVFAWHWKTDLNFAFCFSFSHHFEKRTWISFFDRFSFSHHFEKRKIRWLNNACTLVPTVFRWHGKMEFKFHFHFSFFVFAWQWKTDLNFAFRFSLSPNFEKRIWTSVFVFRFRMTLKNGYEFRFWFSHHFEKRIWISFLYGLLFENRSEFRLLLLHDSWKTDHCTSHLKSSDTPSGFTGEFTFYAKESNWIFSSPGPKWVVNSPAPMICPPHTVLLFNKGLQIIWW